MSIEWLSGQTAALLESDALTKEALARTMVASPLSCSLFAKNSCWGRFWTFIWALSRLINWSGDWQEAAFVRTLQKIERVWKETMQTLEETQTPLNEHLTNAFHRDIPLSQEVRAALRKTLFLFRRHLLSSLQNYGTGTLEEKILFLRRFFSHDNDPSLVANFLEDSAFLWVYDQIDRRFPPTLTAKKVLDREPLDNGDREMWNSFLDHIVEHKARFSPHELFIALKRFCHIHRESEAFPAFLWKVHADLSRRDCPLFDAPDPSHSREVMRYVRRDSTTIAGYTLDAELPGKTLKNRRHVFTIENDPHHLLVFSNNAAALFIEKGAAELGPWRGCLPAIELLQGGLAARVTRLTRGTPSVMTRVAQIAHLIGTLVKEKMWSPLSPDLLFFDGHLKLTKPLPLEPRTNVYDKAMAFISLCTTNGPCQDLLIQQSGLSKHPIGLYYTALLHTSLGSSHQDLEALLKNLTKSLFPIPEIKAHGEKLKESLDQLITSCHNHLLTEYVLDTDTNLKQTIGLSLMRDLMTPPSLNRPLNASSDLISTIALEAAKTGGLSLQPHCFQQRLDRLARGDRYASPAEWGVFHRPQIAELFAASLTAPSSSQALVLHDPFALMSPEE